MSWEQAALVAGFPLLLLLLTLGLGVLENWVLRPEERAAQVRQLLEQVDEVEVVERAVAQLLAEVGATHHRTRAAAAPGVAFRAGAGPSRAPS